jgi:tetratricopeptide (TPR) repeat protein
MRSNSVRQQANHEHHPWDSHFDHHPWNHDWHNYNHYWHHFPYAYGFWPFWDPWYFGFSVPLVSTYVYCYDAEPYYYEAGYAPAATPMVAASVSAESLPPAEPDASGTPADLGTPAEGGGGVGGMTALQLYSGAREAFRTGDYRDALRLGNHAAIESPQNPKVHELISLSLFALGDYRGAAIEAHAALAFGPPSDWRSLVEYYSDAEAYTKQLRAMEKYVGEHKTAAEGHFLSAYHYLMVGGRDEAKAQMAEAARLTPKDKLAAHVLKQLQAGQPVTPPVMEPPKPEPAKLEPPKPQPTK